MATTVAVLEAKLQADTRSFDRSIGRSETGMQKASRGIQKGALIAGAAIATGLGVAAKIGWDEFNQGQKVAAQTNAVLESTGGVANVTAGHVADLATALMKKSGVDDEAIASGQNMLLTFKQVRNETGAGNDIFDKATKATLDLSVAMGKEMPDAAIMVGKALNDPIRGLTAMRRVGIQFTVAQEDQIKKMVESGNVMGAQKLILRELETQFGGSAEAAGKTFGGQINILRESFNNLMGEIVGRVLPRLLALAGFFREHTTILKVLIGTIAGLVVGMIAFTVALKVYRAGVIAATAVQWLWNAAMNANPISLVVLALVALGVGLVIAWKKSETFREIVTGAWDAIKAGAVAMKDGIARAWDAIQNAVRGAIGFVLELFKKYLGGIALILHAMGKMPGPLGAPFRAGAKAVDGLIGKVDDLQGGLNRLSTRKYNIRFVTNAAKVKSTIENFRSSLNWTGTPRGVGDFGSFGLGRTSLVALGRQLQSMGFHVAEHPAFGGVGGGHAPGSYHYAGRAIDINWPGGGSMEMAKLDWLNSRLSRMPGVKELLWRTAGHFDHLHLAMAKGGIFTKPWTGMVSVAERGKPEGFVPLPAGAGSLAGMGGMVAVPAEAVRGALIDGDALYRLWRRGEASWLRRNGG